MSSPLKSIASRWLHATLTQDPSAGSKVATLSRRGFLAMAGALTSCATSRDPLFDYGQQTSHLDPATNRVIPHNPNIRVSPDFTLINEDITYRQARISEKFISMTFDDGPHPQNTPRLLKMLKERNIKATFFVIGKNVESHPDVLRQTVDEGHEIANHTQTHRLLTRLDDDQLRWEISTCRDAIQRACPCDVRLMRPPYGALNERQRQLIYQEFGYPTILWSVDPEDWRRPGPSVVASRIIRDTRAGSIVLAHDLHAPTVSAMPETLDELLYQGYKFVTTSQLLSIQSELARSSSSHQVAAANS